MAVQKVTLANVSGYTDSTAPAGNNSLNTSFGNLFVKEQFTAPAQGQKPGEQKIASSNFLFGNKIVKDKEVKPENSTAKTSNKTSSFGVLSNYLKNIVPTFKQASDKVNQYDAAVNHTLKVIPKAADLEILAHSNPRIAAILSENGLPVKMNYDNLKTIKHTHLATTVEFASAIGKELGLSDSEIKEMETGAALHDIGKSLVPAEILNKQGRLTPEERKIINLHSVLGYELLKGLGQGTNVAEIARDHHNPNSTNKYAQIVRTADVYSAMREERPYKTAKTHEEAMAVLRDMNINSSYLAALDNLYGTKNQEFTVPAHTQFAVA